MEENQIFKDDPEGMAPAEAQADGDAGGGASAAAARGRLDAEHEGQPEVETSDMWLTETDGDMPESVDEQGLTGEPAEEPAGQPVHEPAGGPAEDPAGQRVDEPAGEPVNEPAAEAEGGFIDAPEAEPAVESMPGDFIANMVEKVPLEELDELQEDGEGSREQAEEARDAFAGLASSPARDTAALARDIEALLFISPEPVTLETLAEVIRAEGEELAGAVEAVQAKYTEDRGGIVFAEVAGGYTFRTADGARGAVERFCERPADYSLSPAAMETLAIIAYLQPVTRPEIARIRGVGADTVVGNLLDKGLLAEAGRHEETGAIRYRTTSVFEKLFGLPDLSALPPIEGFEASPEDVEELREKLHLAAEKRA